MNGKVGMLVGALLVMVSFLGYHHVFGTEEGGRFVSVTHTAVAPVTVEVDDCGGTGRPVYFREVPVGTDGLKVSNPTEEEYFWCMVRGGLIDFFRTGRNRELYIVFNPELMPGIRGADGSHPFSYGVPPYSEPMAVYQNRRGLPGNRHDRRVVLSGDLCLEGLYSAQWLHGKIKTSCLYLAVHRISADVALSPINGGYMPFIYPNHLENLGIEMIMFN